MTTSCDEQYRLCKLIDGKNGSTFQDALDEEIDNALDEKAKNIRCIFNNGKLMSIYNDGNPMNSKDRENCLMLDCRSKQGDPDKKGKYGIGGAMARGRLAGQGIQKITTKDGEDILQVVIDMHYLAYKCPIKQCWTSDHDKRPKFKKIKDDGNYKQGVTKEYSGENLKQSFNVHDLVSHLSLKYNNEVKKNIKIVIIWDNKEYDIPDIINNNNADTVIINLDKYDDNSIWYNLNNKQYKVNQNKNGTITCREVKNKIPQGNRITIGLKITKPKFIHPLCLKGGTKEYGWSHRNKNTIEMFKNLSIVDGNLQLQCGKNILIFESDIEESKGFIDNSILILIKKFIPGLKVNMNGHTLSYFNYNRSKEIKGGDLGKRFQDDWLIDLDVSHYDISQENKNRIYLEPTIEKTINKIIQSCNNITATQIKGYEPLPEQEPEPEPEPEPEQEPEPEPEQEPEPEPEPLPEPEPEPLPEPEPEQEPEPEPEQEPEQKPEPEPEQEPEQEPEPEPEPEPEQEPEQEPEPEHEQEPEQEPEQESKKIKPTGNKIYASEEITKKWKENASNKLKNIKDPRMKVEDMNAINKILKEYE
jgi:hypothetical protein